MNPLLTEARDTIFAFVKNHARWQSVNLGTVRHVRDIGADEILPEGTLVHITVTIGQLRRARVLHTALEQATGGQTHVQITSRPSVPAPADPPGPAAAG